MADGHDIEAISACGSYVVASMLPSGQKECAAGAARVVCIGLLLADYAVHDLSCFLVHCLGSVNIEVHCSFV